MFYENYDSEWNFENKENESHFREEAWKIAEVLLNLNNIIGIIKPSYIYCWKKYCHIFSTLESNAKKDINRREALLSQVHLTIIKVNRKLWTNIKDPLQKGYIARVEGSKTQKKELVMVKDVLKKKCEKCYTKVCTKNGYDEKTFIRNQLLPDEHLTATVLGIE